VNWRRKAYEERVRMFKIKLIDVRGVTEGQGRRKRTRKGEESCRKRRGSPQNRQLMKKKRKVNRTLSSPSATSRNH
jgi:hypothetical protein